MRRAAVWALAALLLAGGGCARPRGSPKPSIVLVVVDTLRADHLPTYGYSGVATPSIDALRRDGVLFENAYAHVPLIVILGAH